MLMFPTYCGVVYNRLPALSAQRTRSLVPSLVCEYRPSPIGLRVAGGGTTIICGQRRCVCVLEMAEPVS